MGKDINQIQREVVAWSSKTFPKSTTRSKILHLKSEVEELLEKPFDRSEIADCFILLIHIAHLADMSGDGLIQAASDKMEINKRRKWGQPDANGVVKHLEEVQA